MWNMHNDIYEMTFPLLKMRSPTSLKKGGIFYPEGQYGGTFVNVHSYMHEHTKLQNCCTKLSIKENSLSPFPRLHEQSSKIVKNDPLKDDFVFKSFSSEIKWYNLVRHFPFKSILSTHLKLYNIWRYIWKGKKSNYIIVIMSPATKNPKCTTFDLKTFIRKFTITLLSPGIRSPTSTLW